MRIIKICCLSEFKHTAQCCQPSARILSPISVGQSHLGGGNGKVPPTGRPRSPHRGVGSCRVWGGEGAGAGGHLRPGRGSDSGLRGTSILRALVTGPLDTPVTRWAPPGMGVGTVTQLFCLGLSVWRGAAGGLPAGGGGSWCGGGVRKGLVEKRSSR